MIKGAPLPSVTEDSAGFWEATAAGELRIQRCSNCKRLRFPPRPMCPYCNSLEHTWDAMSGRGRVWSFVVPHPPLLPAFMELAPYNVVVVELDDDPVIRLVGNLLETPDGAINEVEIYELHSVGREHDVGGFEVTVDDAALVSGGERSGDLSRDGDHACYGQSSAGEDVVLPRWVRA